MWYNNVGTSFCCFVTILAFDGQTDVGQKGLGNIVHCIKCSCTVKTIEDVKQTLNFYF